MTRSPVPALAVLCLGVTVDAVALAYLGGLAIGAALETARALRVPLPACATQKRHALLSHPIANRTGVPAAVQVSRTGHLPPALDEDALPPVTSPDTPAPHGRHRAPLTGRALDEDQAARVRAALAELDEDTKLERAGAHRGPR